jgi:hypothetical protein
MKKSGCALSLAILAGACGGGNGGVTPTNPAPIPSANTCTLIGGTSSRPSVEILNGTECSPDGSSVVLLNMTPGGQCSGTMVAPNAVLTAAHCLDEGVAEVTVWLGPPTVPIPAESFVHYPGYVFNTSNSFDVGVIFMADALPRTPFAILTSRDARAGEPAILVGWGRDQNNAPATLRAGSTNLSNVTAGLLETLFAPPSSSVCSGDSGGPILLGEGSTWAIAGITSATSQNVCNTGTNFYQAVRHQSVRDFILQHVPGIGQR